MALSAFPYLAEYNVTHAASLPWGVYYGLLLAGSFNYLVLGVCGISFRNKTGRYSLLRGLCFVALAYILLSTILWFGVYAGVYEEHTGIAIAEIILGLATSLIFLFSISEKQSLNTK